MRDPKTDQLVTELSRIIRLRIEADRLVLPVMPQAANRCLTLLKDPGVATRRIVMVLESDPVFALQVSRAASTAAYGGQPARSLDIALSRLGLVQLRLILVQAATRCLFESPNRGIATRLTQVWKHSIAVAILARDVAALMQLPDTSICYLAGLLHDVGKTVVASLLLEAESSLGRKEWITPEQWSDVVSGSHRPLGIALAEKWNLDGEVIAAIRDCEEYDSGDRQRAANVVRFANALVKTQDHGGGTTEVEDARALVMIGRSMLDLDEDVVARLAEGVKDRVESALAA